MSIKIQDGAGTDLAAVDANKNLKINTPTVKSQAGYTSMLSRNHDGAAGVAALERESEITGDYRLRVGTDSLLWHDTFNHAIFNTSAYQGVTSTMTIALAGGVMSMNSGSSVANAAVCRKQTYRTFQLHTGFSVYFETLMRLTQAPQVNNVVELGFGYAATTATPTDGVYFKYNTSGQLQGVININGTETTTDLTFTPTINQFHHYIISLHTETVEFWIDNILYGAVARPVTSVGMSLASALPILLRTYNAAAISTAQKPEYASLTVSQADMNSSRLWATAMAGMELGAHNVPPGTTAGQTANYTNSAAPASATLSNTAAGYTTLGGQWQFAAVAGAETDYALFGYQVPAGSAALPGKNLVIRGVRIETCNMGAAVATTPHLLQWALGVGATAVSLATADSATAGTRASRRIPLGVQSLPVAAAIGASTTPVYVNLDAPAYVAAGTWVHIILKMPVATATASQIVRGTVTVNGYFE